MSSRSERGAAAVEFALIAMIMVSMIIGIAEFGRAWATQASLAQASREAAREMAISEDAGRAATHFNEVFRPFSAADVSVTPTITVVGTPGDPGCRVNVVAQYELPSLTNFIRSTFTVRGQGVMRCGG